jgi:2-polyprenyl-6-hydroxyphenyl methylase/3-demethylubiquinone-9 3-methyltransferase
MLQEVLSLYDECSYINRLFIRQSLKVIPYLQIETYVPKKGKVIDFGCGHGLFTNILAICSDQRNVIGCDIDSRKIQIAERSVKYRRNICFLNECRLNSKVKLSGIIALSVLYLIPFKKQEDLIRQFISMLDEKGRLIIVEFDKKPLFKFYWGYLREYLMKVIYTKSEGLFFRSKNEYLDLFDTLNLNVRFYSLNMSMYPSIVYVCTKRS